ncbi:MAG: putative sulfate exporter family transporter [Bacteroidales bacterium]|nr:putative sulfate exporter family transporter [Bacteroidales bacterium]MDY2932061.1 putative sulfate exporter family transporter [Muribaculaceae bacterium]MDD6132370.1 putative sulfate exporter family transporter [Bacteroidales bacterium]MDD6851898.1 putative sulfate exporter family transporter [Bacteroidales bacterium]MDD7404771.1 putative sulfate exporter family transporter [Bacteroidales bacterium]
MNVKVKSAVYILLFVFFAIPFNAFGIGFVTPALALFVGLMYALILGDVPYGKFNKKCSKYLLQAAVVGLGFGMNFEQSIQAGKDGMLLTIASVFVVMILAVFIGKKMKLDDKTSYLIGSGTAICGGSAIAAIGPVIKADDNQMAVSLGTIFMLNAIALFIFPPIGRMIGLTDAQFGTWAAIAIHDTSSVVGAGQAFSDKALEIATLVKLTRALWIIPLAIVTTFVYREKSKKITIPWFIFLFILAMLVNTYAGIPAEVSKWIVLIAKQGMVLTLFLIGSSLSINVVKKVGLTPVILGVVLWVIIGIVSLGAILLI